MSEPASPAPIDELVQKTAATVREQPVKSVVWAFFIGVLLTIFPLRKIVASLVSLALALLRPALLLLGGLKLWEEIEERRK